MCMARSHASEYDSGMVLGWLPKAAYGIVHELTRHILKRPVVGIAAVARTRDGKIVLIRRADNGMWCLPGGTLEWGETLATGLARELEEEAGIGRSRARCVVGSDAGCTLSCGHDRRPLRGR